MPKGLTLFDAGAGALSRHSEQLPMTNEPLALIIAVHYNERYKRETYTLDNIPFRIIEAPAQES